jgi:hypothetical protein
MTAQSQKRKEDWMNTKWRPAMGWMYMLTCITDFVIFPILWSLLQALDKGSVTTQWQPLTLQGAGLFHIAMGAVLGVAAYGRTQEKLGGAANVETTNLSSVGTTTFSVPSTNSTPTSNTEFSVSQSNFPSAPMARGPVTQPAFTPARQTVVSRSGKLGPMQSPDTEL